MNTASRTLPTGAVLPGQGGVRRGQQRKSKAETRWLALMEGPLWEDDHEQWPPLQAR